MIATRRLLLLGLAYVLAGVRPAFAHAALVRSDPPRRAVLTQPPAQIRLWFNETIEPEYSSITLLDVAGQPVPTGRPALSPTDPKLLVLDLPPLTAGEYTVRYRVNSIDGHIVEASYRFRLKAATGGE
jgi:copper resistance protein C